MSTSFIYIFQPRAVLNIMIIDSLEKVKKEKKCVSVDSTQNSIDVVCLNSILYCSFFYRSSIIFKKSLRIHKNEWSMWW